MLVSNAVAAHGVAGTETSAGGNALLIIIGVGIALALAHKGHKKWRSRKLRQNGDDEPGDQ